MSMSDHAPCNLVWAYMYKVSGPCLLVVSDTRVLEGPVTDQCFVYISVISTADRSVYIINIQPFCVEYRYILHTQGRNISLGLRPREIFSTKSAIYAGISQGLGLNI